MRRSRRGGGSGEDDLGVCGDDVFITASWYLMRKEKDKDKKAKDWCFGRDIYLNAVQKKMVVRA